MLKSHIYAIQIFLFCLCSLNGLAQNSKIDSLEKVLRTAKEDTSKVNRLIEISANLMSIADFDRMEKYLNEGEALSKKIDYQKGLADIYFIKATSTFMSPANFGSKDEAKKIDETIQLLSKAFDIYVLLKDKIKSNNVAILIGKSYMKYENYSESLRWYYLALREIENGDNPLFQTYTLLQIAYVYDMQNNKSEAEKKLKEALKYSKLTNNEDVKSRVYIQLASLYLSINNIDEAKRYDSLAFNYYQQTQDQNGISTHYWNSADFYQKEAEVAFAAGNTSLSKQKYTAAIEMLLKSVTLMEELQNIGGVSDAYAIISRLSTRINKLTDAKKYGEKSLFFAKKYGYKDNFKNTYEALSMLDSAEGNFKSAYENYKLYNIYKDSLIDKDAERKSLQLNFQYEYDKKEAAAKLNQEKKDAALKRTRYFQYTAIGIFILLSSFLFWNNRQKQRSNEKIQEAFNVLQTTQKQLIQSEKMASLGELTAGIAHEIQNPLNFVNNFSELSNELITEMNEEIDKGNTDEVKAIASDIKQNLEKINHHGKRADSIVKGMLQHSQKGSGQKEPTDINAMAEEYLRLSYHGTLAKDITLNALFVTDFDKTIGNVNVVQQDISKVLLNLYNNAFYAVAERQKKESGDYQPTVTLTTMKKGDTIEIGVKDNGTGIADNIKDKIFQPFFTTKPTGQGTGLGLSLSYDIMNALSGEIKVETQEGEGSEFVIQLPI